MENSFFAQALIDFSESIEYVNKQLLSEIEVADLRRIMADLRHVITLDGFHSTGAHCQMTDPVNMIDVLEKIPS